MRIDPERLEAIFDAARALYDEAVEHMALEAAQNLKRIGGALSIGKAAVAVAVAYRVDVETVYQTPVMLDVLAQVLYWAKGAK